MALILSAATGNFNAGATWVGGIVPGVGDEARASTGHTITITANVTCTELSNAGTGTYVLNNGVTLTANVTHKGTTASVSCLTFSAASPAAASIVGNLTGGSVISAYAVTHSGTGTLTITGTTHTSGTAVSGGGAYAINLSGSGVCNITGNLNCGTSGANNHCLILNVSSGAATAFVTGNVSGGTGTSTNAVGVTNTLNGSVSITGNVTGGNSSLSYGVTNNSAGSATITGNITASTAAGVSNTSTGTLIISGGTYTASTVANAVISTNASSIVRVSGSFIYAANGFVPINTPKFILLSTPTLAKTRYALNGSTTYVDMFTSDNSLGQAAITDVRFGTVYASGALTGVAYIPAAGSVAFGVPTDNTVGTAALTPAAVWEYATRTLTAGAGISASDVWSHASRTLTSASGPSATDIRQEMDTNSTKLANLDTTISSRLASSVSTNITAIKAKTDALVTERLAQCATTSIVGNLIAQSNS